MNEIKDSINKYEEILRAKKISAKDISEATGISYQTVARIVSGKRQLGDLTLTQVQTIIDYLDSLGLDYDRLDTIAKKTVYYNTDLPAENGGII